MRVVLKEIHKVNKRLATGELKTYYYAWRGGPQIKASPGSPEFVRLYNDAYANLRKPAAGTLMTIIAEYKASAEYNRLQPSTLRAYAAYIRLIEQEFGDMPLAALQTRASAATSSSGAIRLLRRRARPTMRGPPSRGYCPLPRIER